MKKILYIGNKLVRHGLSPTSIDTLGPLLQGEGFEVSYSSSKKNKLLRLMDMLWSIYKNNQVDYVLIDTYSTSNFWYAFASSQLCRCLKLQYIPILHGGNLAYRLRNNPLICKLIFGYAYQNVSPSLFLMEEFKKEGFEKMVLIPNSIELENYPFLPRTIAQPQLLWVRSFAKIYNPIMAVEVFSLIKKKYPKASLAMLGADKDGSLAYVKNRAKELELQVLFMGNLSKEDWIRYSKGFSIFINTSHFDNMPVSVIEAMSLGMPVVSTNVGGIPFLLQHQKEALLVGDGDINAMVEAIDQLLEDAALFEKLSINARIKAEQFDWAMIKNRWSTILR